MRLGIGHGRRSAPCGVESAVGARRMMLGTRRGRSRNRWERGEDGEDDGEEQKDARDSTVQPRMIHSPITVRAGKAPDTQATSRRSPSGGRASA